jgi:pimeloyl-ACP methyl ester carboxylesterase
MTAEAAPVSPHKVTVNRVDFAYLAAGERGPLAACLHGFRDSAHTWRHLLPPLAEAGYRAVAPFQRGYSPTAVPDDGRYQIGMLAMDAIELHRALGGDEPGVIIGHDWGVPAAHGAANHAPERWTKVVSIAVPPGEALTSALVTNPAQLTRSWYFFFFFLHDLSDLVVAANDLAFVDLLWSDWSPGFDAAVEIAHVKTCLRDPGTSRPRWATTEPLSATATWTRPSPTCKPRPAGCRLSRCCTSHGTNDGCIGREVAESARSMVTANVTIEILDNCGHFLQLERPEAMNSRILEFLA